MGGVKKALGYRMIELRLNAGVIIADIQDTGWFVVEAKLTPGEHFKELLESSESARQSEESVGQIGHQGLTLVHVVHDPQIDQTRHGDFPLEERLWNNADDFPTRFDRALSGDTHQTNSATPIDQTHPAFSESAAYELGGDGIVRMPTRV